MGGRQVRDAVLPHQPADVHDDGRGAVSASSPPETRGQAAPWWATLQPFARREVWFQFRSAMASTQSWHTRSVPRTAARAPTERNVGEKTGSSKPRKDELAE